MKYSVSPRGGGVTIYLPRRWQFDPKIAADLRLWWPAVAKLQAASVPVA